MVLVDNDPVLRSPFTAPDVISLRSFPECATWHQHQAPCGGTIFGRGVMFPNPRLTPAPPPRPAATAASRGWRRRVPRRAAGVRMAVHRDQVAQRKHLARCFGARCGSGACRHVSHLACHCLVLEHKDMPGTVDVGVSGLALRPARPHCRRRQGRRPHALPRHPPPGHPRYRAHVPLARRRQIVIFRIADGKIAEAWEVYDEAGRRPYRRRLACCDDGGDTRGGRRRSRSRR